MIKLIVTFLIVTYFGTTETLSRESRMKEICSNNTDNYKNKCPPGWIGDECNIATCTESNPCLNNARCHVELNMHICRCDSEHYGPICQFKICDVHDCIGPICYLNTNNTKVCVCIPLNNPTYCFKNCVNLICLNDGVCANYLSEDMCICKDGYFGNLCQYECILKCIHGKCKINIVDDLEYCECQTGYEGHDCSIKIEKTTLAPNPNCSFCNFHGNCTELNGKTICACYKDYVGKYCDSQCIPKCEASKICSLKDGIATCVKDGSDSNDEKILFGSKKNKNIFISLMTSSLLLLFVALTLVGYYMHNKRKINVKNQTFSKTTSKIPLTDSS